MDSNVHTLTLPIKVPGHNNEMEGRLGDRTI